MSTSTETTVIPLATFAEMIRTDINHAREIIQDMALHGIHSIIDVTGEGDGEVYTFSLTSWTEDR